MLVSNTEILKIHKMIYNDLNKLIINIIYGLTFIKNNNIRNSCVSFSLNHFKSRFNNKYNLSILN